MISTHVLDVMRGIPAAGVKVRLLRVEGTHRVLLGTSQTDAAGRIAAVLAAEPSPGTYVLVFHAGEYFAAADIATFFDEIPVRFVVADGGEHYHVPLLLSAYAYTTYRGS